MAPGLQSVRPVSLIPATHPNHPSEVEYRRGPVTNRLVLAFKAPRH